MQVVTKIAGIYAERLMSDVMYVFFLFISRSSFLNMFVHSWENSRISYKVNDKIDNIQQLLGYLTISLKN